MAEIPKIVTQRLQGKSRDQAHPDPDLISAFVENSLTQPDRNQLLEHLASCPDCREVVTLSLPEQADALRPGVRAAGSPWLSWPVLRWGALAACVVVVGAAVTLRYESRSKSYRLIAPQAPEMQRMNETVVQPPSPHKPENANAVNQFSSQPSVGTAGAGTAAKLQLKTAPSKVATPLEANKELSEAKMALQRKSVLAETGTAEVNAGAEPAFPVPSSAPDELVPGRAKDVPLESQAYKAKAAVGGPMLVKPTMSAPALAVNKTALVPITTLLPRWTLSSDGTLQRSLDSGNTWETIPVPTQAILRALAANGLDIWVGGSGGALYHSSDAGQHWTQVRPTANGEVLTADIIGVEFTDLQHGTLTTSAKETWVTDDAGETWQRR
jgi:hypothetical protein